MRSEIGSNIAEKRDAFKSKFTELKNHTPSVKKKIGIAFVLGTAALGVNWGVAPFVAAKNYELVPTDWNAAVVLGASWGFNIASTLINMNQQRRLLERFGLDQDWTQTAAFHALGKLKTLEKKERTRSITAVSGSTVVSNLVFFGIKEYLTFSVANTLLSSGIEGVAVLKALQGGSNLIQAGVGEVALRIAGNKEKKRAKSLPSNGEIVNLKQNP